jgi:hypothetical protein
MGEVCFRRPDEGLTNTLVVKEVYEFTGFFLVD